MFTGTCMCLGTWLLEPVINRAFVKDPYRALLAVTRLTYFLRLTDFLVLSV